MAYAPTVQAETGITTTAADHFARNGSLRSDCLAPPTSTPGLHAAVAILACLRAARAPPGPHRCGVSINARFACGPVRHRTRCIARGQRPVRAARLTIREPDEPGRQHVLPSTWRPCAGRISPGSRGPARRLRLRNLDAGPPRIVQEWIWTFADMESLDAQLDEAKIATGLVRSVQEFATATGRASGRRSGPCPTAPGGDHRVRAAVTSPRTGWWPDGGSCRPGRARRRCWSSSGSAPAAIDYRPPAAAPDPHCAWQWRLRTSGSGEPGRLRAPRARAEGHALVSGGAAQGEQADPVRRRRRERGQGPDIQRSPRTRPGAVAATLAKARPGGAVAGEEPYTVGPGRRARPAQKPPPWPPAAAASGGASVPA